MVPLYDATYDFKPGENPRKFGIHMVNYILNIKYFYFYQLIFDKNPKYNLKTLNKAMNL